jgi:threonine dehydrogenase-like Zn-dependent dehydrogenase
VVLDTRAQPVSSWVEESGTKFAAALECSAAPGAFSELLTVLEPGGTCVEVALTPEEAALPLFFMLSEGLRIAGSCAFSDETYRAAVDHLINGRVPVHRLISERVSLADTPSALERLRTPGTLVRILSRPWD